MSTQPTDAEIVALADATRTAEGGANGYILPTSFARAVLAKWGAQPVAPIPDLGFIIEKRAGVAVLAWDKGGCRPAASTEIAMWHSLAAAPQPVVRKPLTNKQIARIARSVLETPVADGVAPAWTLAVDIARAIEAAHGITGDQHGAE